MHKWISTDNGSQCYRCGIVLDYIDPDQGDTSPALVTDERTEMEAMRFVPFCPGPVTERSHHYVFEGDRIACAYGDSIITLDTENVQPECVGA